MIQIVVHGILKKNTKGRCYLVYTDSDNKRKITKIGGAVDFPGGQSVTIIGLFENNLLRPLKIIPQYYPRKILNAG